MKGIGTSPALAHVGAGLCLSLQQDYIPTVTLPLASHVSWQRRLLPLLPHQFFGTPLVGQTLWLVPLLLADLGASAFTISLAGAAYGVIGLASANLGRLSDRLRTPIGRRRPFILVGDALALLYFGVQMVQPAMLALSLPDNFPVAQHGRVRGAVQTASVAGNLAITILIAATLDAFGFEFAFRALAFFAIPALLTGLLANEGALDSATAQRRGTSPLSDPTTDPAARSLSRNDLVQAFTTVRAYPRVVRFWGFAFVFSVGYNLMLWLSTLYF